MFMSYAARHPRTHPKPIAGHGFTLLELLIIIGIISLLLALLVPVYAKVRQTQRSVQCVATVSKLAQGFQSYVLAHRGRFPDPGTVDASWEEIIHPYFNGKLECPADSELYPAIGSSYDWRDTGADSTTLAGKLLASIQRSDAVIVFEAMPGWHNKGQLNVARIDGSASSMDEEDCYKDLATPLNQSR